MAQSLQGDPVQNAIYGGIKRSIELCIENKCIAAAVILTYSGIDAMAYLSMPAGQVDVNRSDFIAWCNKFIQLPGNEQIDGVEYYGARFSILHTYGVESRLSREKKCRKIGYMDHGVPPIRFDATEDPDFLLLSVKAFTDAFLNGVDRFLINAFADTERASLIESRLPHILVQFPVSAYVPSSPQGVT